MPVESFSVEAEDLILQRLLNTIVFKDPARTGFYLDIGANHPVVGSNTHFFYQRGWRGINVEPNPELMELFRSERPEDLTLNVGLSDTSGTLEYHMFENMVLNGFFGQDMVDYHLALGQKHLRTIPVECLATGDFLKNHAMQPIDILNLDIETREPQVLTTWDWVSCRPKLICVEIHGVTLDQITSSWVATFLTKHGYTLMSRIWQSAIFVDNCFLSPSPEPDSQH